jgi:hypothetical protein
MDSIWNEIKKLKMIDYDLKGTLADELYTLRYRPGPMDNLVPYYEPKNPARSPPKNDEAFSALLEKDTSFFDIFDEKKPENLHLCANVYPLREGCTPLISFNVNIIVRNKQGEVLNLHLPNALEAGFKAANLLVKIPEGYRMFDVIVDGHHGFASAF